jgi:osmotically-inducible protein OsmY
MEKERSIYRSKLLIGVSDFIIYRNLSPSISVLSKEDMVTHIAQFSVRDEMEGTNIMVTNLSTDEEIQRDVLAELKWDQRVQSNEIGVAVKDGIVTLTGWVDSYLKKFAAEDAAQRVRNVRAVINHLEVHLSGSAERTDPDLAAAVLNALTWNVGIPAGKLEVTVSQGWVTLKGEVEQGYQKEDAERIISHLAGIRGITNLIVVKPRVVPLDRKQRIEKALARNAEVDAISIAVEVEGSKVILRGAVRSYAGWKAAQKIAQSTPGVTEVENRIVISYK